MTFKDYQDQVNNTKVYKEKGHEIIYPLIGLSGEVGELAEKVKKWLRGDYPELDNDALKKELGDILWYCAAFADDIGFTLEQVAEANYEKVTKRKKLGITKGNGDNREEELSNIFKTFKEQEA